MLPEVTVRRRLEDLKPERMKTLYQLALAAVPNPGYMAKTFLVSHHPAAEDLEERQYNEDSARWQKEHRLKFRYVVFDLHVIKDMFGSLYPSNVETFTRLQKTVDALYTSLFST